MNFSARYADSTIHKWIKDANKNGNKIESRGSGNFSSDEAKEIARLRKELKDTQDALEVLKKQKDSTVSVSSVLKKLDVSRSGFYDYLKRVPSKTKLRKERITKEIKKIHKESYEIYGSPKITELLNKKGEKVSQKYVYSIMKENNIKAKYIKPYIQTTVSHDFSDKLKNLLNRHYDPTKPNVAW